MSSPVDALDTSDAAMPARPPWRRAGDWLLASGSLLALLLAWELVTRAQLFTEYLLPAPETVLLRLAGDLASGELVTMLAVTLATMLGGFVIAAAAGVAIGIGVARIGWLRWFADPLVSVGLPLPKIAFLPIFLLWFGPTDQARVAITAFAAVFPVIVASWAAANSVERSLIWSARSLGCSEGALLWQVMLPAALPQIFTGLQIALPVSLVTAIVAEMMTGSDGVGGAMLRAMRFADSPGVFAGILAIAFLGGLVIKGMELTRRLLLRWHQEGQA